MSWEVLVPIIAQYGLPLAENLWLKWSSGNPPSQADWDELRLLSQQTAKDRMILALQSAGIDPGSDQGKKLLALAG